MSGNTRYSLTGKEYNQYLESEDANVTASPFSRATNYREFLGANRVALSDQPMTELGITNQTIAECVPSAPKPK